MKQTISAIASLLALSTSALAQYTNQSSPFYLVISSEDSKYNGTALEECHEGAAIEGLCIGVPVAQINASTAGYSTYTFNTSSDEVVATSSLGTPGYLVSELRGSNFNRKYSPKSPKSRVGR